MGRHHNQIGVLRCLVVEQCSRDWPLQHRAAGTHARRAKSPLQRQQLGPGLRLELLSCLGVHLRHPRPFRLADEGKAGQLEDVDEQDLAALSAGDQLGHTQRFLALRGTIGRNQQASQHRLSSSANWYQPRPALLTADC
jgi:hypothetical protein